MQTDTDNNENNVTTITLQDAAAGPSLAPRNFFASLSDDLIAIIMLYVLDSGSLKARSSLAAFNATCRRFHAIVEEELKSKGFPQRVYRVHYPIARNSLFGDRFPQNINWTSLLSFEQQQPLGTSHPNPSLRNKQRFALAEQFSRLKADEQDTHYVSPIHLFQSYDKEHRLLSRIAYVRDDAGNSPASQYCQWFYEVRIKNASLMPGGNTLLHWAALLAGKETVTALLALSGNGDEQNTDVLAEGELKLRPLECAIYANNIPALRALLENNAVIVAYANQLRNSHNMSPFELAVKWNNPAALELLIANNTLLNAYLQNILVHTAVGQKTVLNFVGANSDIALLSSLICNSSIRSRLCTHYQENPDKYLLNYFILSGRRDVIKMISQWEGLWLALASPIFPDNGEDAYARDPLEAAIRCDNLEIARFCLYDIGISGLRENHPHRIEDIVLAATNKPCYETLSLLLVRPEILRHFSFNALLYQVAKQPAASHPKKYELITWLLTCESLFTYYYKPTASSKTPLDGAIEIDDPQALQLLCASKLLREKVIAELNRYKNKNPLFSCHTVPILGEFLKYDDLILACKNNLTCYMERWRCSTLISNGSHCSEQRYNVVMCMFEHAVLGPAILENLTKATLLTDAISRLSVEQYKRLLDINVLKQHLMKTPSLAQSLLNKAEKEKKQEIVSLIGEQLAKDALTLDFNCMKQYKKGKFRLCFASDNPDLGMEAKALMLKKTLTTYIVKRTTEARQIRAIGIFRVGYTRGQKLAASQALLTKIRENKDIQSADSFTKQERKILLNGRLGKIYKAALKIKAR